MHRLKLEEKQLKVNQLLSIPFIGIFALHLLVKNPYLNDSAYSFNSLYWDFCFASAASNNQSTNPSKSFNSLYWDFCFASTMKRIKVSVDVYDFQFPLLGFLLCITFYLVEVSLEDFYLSIPFIGIFALHP